jgi:redox-sensitive bicupin YhaK (pirin superfamily)
VLIGSFSGVESPARADTDHLGVDLVLAPGTTTLPVEPHHEHAVVVLSGAVRVEGEHVGADVLAYLGTGRDELTLTVDEPARLILLGGTPFEARPLMWWNFVARRHAEIEAAYRAWQTGDERFGAVRSALDVVEAPTPPWMTTGAPFTRP